MKLPASVKLVEVGPRDGLQNESGVVPAAVKIAFLQALARAGYSEIEATSFVSPKWVPQLADAAEVSGQLESHPGLTYTALVPNLQGLQQALQCGYRRVAIFTAASEDFSQKNTNRSLAQSLKDFTPVMNLAKERGVSVRGYLSTCWYCPYAGKVEALKVAEMAGRLLELGVDQVSLGDTVGLASPNEIERTLNTLKSAGVPWDRLALHLHDTHGTALANALVGLQMGITTYDCSAGGLGGCPYAPGASGNLASEDLISMLDGLGVECGVELEKVAAASLRLASFLQRELPSRRLAAYRSQLRRLAAPQP